MSYAEEIFDIKAQVAVITGAGGYLCSEMAIGLAKAGAKIAVLDLRINKAQAVAEKIIDLGGEAIAVEIDVGKNPGRIAFTRTPSKAHSLAKFWVRFLIPALATEYGKTFDNGGPAEAEDMLIIEPVCFSTIYFPNT